MKIVCPFILMSILHNLCMYQFFRFVVLHKPHCPHAWCDTLRIICVTDDKAESWGELGNPQWTTVATTDEMVNIPNFLKFLL